MKEKILKSMTDIEKNIRSYKNKTCKNQHKTQIGERRLQSQIAHAHLTQTFGISTNTVGRILKENA